MDQQEWLAQQFEDHRPHLRAVAYRMLGSLSEADDALQDAWVRLSRADTSEVENLEGWLTTIVARVALNMLRARKTRREQPLDVHVPDPIIDSADGTDPEHEALLADSVGLALLVVLETLTPAERLAFVLHDMFAVPFEEIAPIVERSPEATRQLASRARRRVRGRPTVPDAGLERPMGGCRSVPRSRPERRLRCACRRARSRCRAPGRRRANWPITAGSGSGDHRQPGPALVPGRPDDAARAHQWCGGDCHLPPRAALLGRRHHGEKRQDRRSRLPCRPATHCAARPRGGRRLRYGIG